MAEEKEAVLTGRQEIKTKIAELEAAMAAPDFWQDKVRAQAAIKELQELKTEATGGGKYDNGEAIITIFGGAGGTDAEDFARMLYEMYEKYAAKVGFPLYLVHKNENDHGGYRNITFEVRGQRAYGILKGESGVHRLVRISPFNAKSQRHTSFALVEVIPKFDKAPDIVIDERDLKIDFARSSGPGGQNVNKRETAVRIVHVPTNLAVHVESERSQERNREKALEILRGKLYKRAEEERLAKEAGMYISKTTENEWGSQIRSYVLHPYKMVKDHRTKVETTNVEGVLNGDLDLFLNSPKS